MPPLAAEGSGRDRDGTSTCASAMLTSVPTSAFSRALALAALRRLRHGRLELIEGRRRVVFGPPDAALQAQVRVVDAGVWRSLARGTVGIAERWMDDAWDCDDLVSLGRMFLRELRRFDRVRRLLVPAQRAAGLIPENTRMGARRNVTAHYDLGNDLFALFLDDTMTYSCAFFERPDLSLSEAQEAKLDLACRRLDLQPGDHLLELGTGWGSLALHAASRYGCRVTTTTISHAQHELAVRRVSEAGLTDRVTVLMDDYRDVRGRFDKLVSIEMVEAIGWQYFDLFFRRCSELLRPDGLMLLQAIVIDDQAFEAEKASKTFANTLVFPGGCLPSREVIRRCISRSTDMRALTVQDITGHYPETLRRWRSRFLSRADEAEALGYDRRFAGSGSSTWPGARRASSRGACGTFRSSSPSLGIARLVAGLPGRRWHEAQAAAA
jgi:cyclopropane-fatty-acyl-phospholipid synthase